MEVKMKAETKEVKKVNVYSVAKIIAIFGIVMGLLYGIQVGITSMSNPLTFAEATSYATQDATIAVTAYSIALGWWMLIIGPALYAVIYFISGLIMGLLYNLFSKYVGGVKVVLN